ncbi:Uncharacterised protein [Chlamydia trachomatis]|nr:Uncharacterised protein [Chlamydia trachomatis]
MFDVTFVGGSCFLSQNQTILVSHSMSLITKVKFAHLLNPSCISINVWLNNFLDH